MKLSVDFSLRQKQFQVCGFSSAEAHNIEGKILGNTFILSNYQKYHVDANDHQEAQER